MSAPDLVDRSRAWRELLASGLIERERVPGGLKLSAAAAAAAALMDLIELERQCCAWIQFEVNDESVVTLTAEGDGEAVLARMFRPT